MVMVAVTLIYLLCGVQPMLITLPAMISLETLLGILLTFIQMIFETSVLPLGIPFDFSLGKAQLLLSLLLMAH
jgi:hypothetical protein